MSDGIGSKNDNIRRQLALSLVAGPLLLSGRAGAQPATPTATTTANATAITVGATATPPP